MVSLRLSRIGPAGVPLGLSVVSLPDPLFLAVFFKFGLGWLVLTPIPVYPAGEARIAGGCLEDVSRIRGGWLYDLPKTGLDELVF